MIHARKLAIGFVLATCLATSSAFAEPTPREKEAARELLDDGDAKLEAGDANGALEKYRAADAIMHVPSTGVEVVHALRVLGRFIEARETALTVSRFPIAAGEPLAFAAARTEAAKLAANLGEKIPSLTIKVAGPSASPVTITLDGAALPDAAGSSPHRVDPGKHVVTASAAGFLTERRESFVAEGETRVVEITLEHEPAATSATTPAPPIATTQAAPATPPDADSGQNTAYSPIMYGSFAAGAVGLGVGVITGLISLGKTSDVKNACAGSRCPTSVQSDASSATTMAWISDAGFAVGVTGLGAGTYFLVKGPVRVSPAVSMDARGGKLGLTGRF